jgi:peptidyl-prolyl cis-trans isomerase A (cyclophilin A)
MKIRLPLIALAACLVSFSALAAGPERVRVTTNLGSFVIELQRDRAPLTVENFMNYVRGGQYTNTLFHRVISGFLIQGGGVGTDYKPKPTLKPIANEAGNGLRNFRGTVGLARASGPHTGDAQFFINVADNADLDPLPTRWGYAVFGKIVEGMEVVDRINISPTGSMGPFKQDAPLQAVVIHKIEIISEGTPAAPAAAPATPSPPASQPDAATSPAQDSPPQGSSPPK